MDYEQKYKEALDEAKAIHKAIKQDLKPVIEQIFPELKKLDDDRIRKELIKLLRNLFNNYSYFIKDPFYTECINWLEKQGNEISEKEFTFKSLPRLLEMIEVSDRAKAYTEKLAVTLDNEGYHTDAKIVRERIKIMNGEEVPMATMDEQKPIDKVEPKFNLYDWVVTDKGDVVQIGAVNNGYYTLFNGMDFNMSYVDKCWHLWTNQDIKDGDILCTYECDKPKIIFILKTTPRNPYILKYHCYYNIMYPYFEPNSETGCLAVNDGDLKPATKEQRDTLFEKMKLEGYRWDKDKKKVVRFETFVRRKESDFAFKEDENGVIKFVHKKSKV